MLDNEEFGIKAGTFISSYSTSGQIFQFNWTEPHRKKQQSDYLTVYQMQSGPGLRVKFGRAEPNQKPAGEKSLESRTHWKFIHFSL